MNIDKKTHIYSITCTVNDKCYIGKTVNLNRRWREHLNMLRNNKHHSQKLQRAWNKYGEDKFVFEIVEYCHMGFREAIEEYWINDIYDSYKNGYNSHPYSIGNASGWKHTQKAKDSMSLSKKGRVSNRKGAVLSEETKDKLRKFNLGRKMPEEQRLKQIGRTFSMPLSAKENISIAAGEKFYYEILFEDGEVKTLNHFRKYCTENNINYKVLHQWSLNHLRDNEVHPTYKIKILKLENRELQKSVQEV